MCSVHRFLSDYRLHHFINFIWLASLLDNMGWRLSLHLYVRGQLFETLPWLTWVHMLLNVRVDLCCYCLLLWSGHRVSLLMLLRTWLKLLLMRWIFHTVIRRLFRVTLALFMQVRCRVLPQIILFLRIWFRGHVKHLSIADWVCRQFFFLFNLLLLLVLLLRAIFFHID